jgi:general stress protein 26
MPGKTLPDLAEDMRGIDIAMLSTLTEAGEIASRPMSNNRDVAYDGRSHYFTRAETRMVHDIERDPKVGLAFSTPPGILSGAGLFVAVEGRAEVVRDKAAFAAHWNPDLERWFEDGVDTPGLVMLTVHAERIKYWRGEEQGEIAV